MVVLPVILMTTKEIYGDICSRWDFSDNIKSIGDLYIKNTFTDNQKFICIHIRLLML